MWLLVQKKKEFFSISIFRDWIKKYCIVYFCSEKLPGLKEYIMRILWREKYESLFKKVNATEEVASRANFRFVHSIAEHLKPFTDGELINDYSSKRFQKH